MWLLYATFEDFIEFNLPTKAAGMKRYTTASRSKDRVDGTDCSATWLTRPSSLLTNVPELHGWLRPEEEPESWSDDSRRLEKLSDEEKSHLEDEVNNPLYLKVKKIDKCSVKTHRTPERRHGSKAAKDRWEQSFVDPNNNNTPEVDRTLYDIDTCVVAADDAHSQLVPGNHHDELGLSCPNDLPWDQTVPIVGFRGPVSPVGLCSFNDETECTRQQSDISMYTPLGSILDCEVSTATSSEGSYISLKEGSFITKYNVAPQSALGADMSPVKRDNDYDNLQLATRLESHVSADGRDIERTTRTGANGKPLFSVGFRRSLEIADPTRKKQGQRKQKARPKSLLPGLDVCPPEESSSSEDENPAYENLPTALYAQVSPPRPRCVTMPGLINRTLMLQSTPMDPNHRPKICSPSVGSAGRTFDSGVKNQIRSRIGNWMSNSARKFVSGGEAIRARQLQEHSIAELRKTPYVCMNQTRHKFMQTPISIPVHAVRPKSLGVRPLDDLTFNEDEEDTIYARTPDWAPMYDSSDSEHSGYFSSSDSGSPLGDTTVASFTFNPSQKELVVSGRKKVVRREPIYDTIADKTAASPDYTKLPVAMLNSAGSKNDSSDHLYCKIGDVASLIKPQVPPEPPARRKLDDRLNKTAHDDVIYVNTLQEGRDITYADYINLVSEGNDPTNNGQNASGGSQTKSNSQEVGMMADQGSQLANGKDGPHAYTVADILASFGRFAGGILKPRHRENIYQLLSKSKDRRRVSKCLQTNNCGRDFKPHKLQVSPSRGHQHQHDQARTNLLGDLMLHTEVNLKHPEVHAAQPETSTRDAAGSMLSPIQDAPATEVITAPAKENPVYTTVLKASHAKGYPGYMHPLEKKTSFAAIRKTLSFNDVTPTASPPLMRNMRAMSIDSPQAEGHVIRSRDKRRHHSMHQGAPRFFPVPEIDSCEQRSAVVHQRCQSMDQDGPHTLVLAQRRQNDNNTAAHKQTAATSNNTSNVARDCSSIKPGRQAYQQSAHVVPTHQRCVSLDLNPPRPALPIQDRVRRSQIGKLATTNSTEENAQKPDRMQRCTSLNIANLMSSNTRLGPGEHSDPLQVTSVVHPRCQSLDCTSLPCSSPAWEKKNVTRTEAPCSTKTNGRCPVDQTQTHTLPSGPFFKQEKDAGQTLNVSRQRCQSLDQIFSPLSDSEAGYENIGAMLVWGIRKQQQQQHQLHQQQHSKKHAGPAQKQELPPPLSTHGRIRTPSNRSANSLSIYWTGQGANREIFC